MPWWDGLNVKDFVIELILKHAIGRYVKEINKSMFKVNISKGRAEVVNLEIRPDALDAFRLPIAVTEGVIGHLRIDVPWVGDIGTKPVNLELRDVRIVVKPLAAFDMGGGGGEGRSAAEAEAAGAHAKKLARLRAAMEEAARLKAERWSNAAGSKQLSWLENMKLAVSRLIRVSVRRVHIQYEDAITAPSDPYTLGIVLDYFSLDACTETCCASLTTGAGGEAVAAQGAALKSFMHKLIKVSGGSRPRHAGPGTSGAGPPLVLLTLLARPFPVPPPRCEASPST
jgi:hypothetical protein